MTRLEREIDEGLRKRILLAIHQSPIGRVTRDELRQAVGKYLAEMEAMLFEEKDNE